VPSAPERNEDFQIQEGTKVAALASLSRIRKSRRLRSPNSSGFPVRLRAVSPGLSRVEANLPSRLRAVKARRDSDICFALPFTFTSETASYRGNPGTEA